MKAVVRFLSLIILSGLARGQAAQQVPIALVHVTVIDMTGAAPKPDMTVIVQDHRIASLGPSSTTLPPRGARVIDAHGKYLIPGLWDMHTHNFFGPNHTFDSLYIANGITGIRDMGGMWEYYDVMADARRAGRPLNGGWPAPRIVAAGVILDGTPPVHPTNLAVGNAQQARQAVDLVKRRGVDFVKVYNMLNRTEYYAIAGEAKRVGLPFVGHVPFTVTAAEASDIGQKSIEHSDGLLLATSADESRLRRQLLSAVQQAKSPADISALVEHYYRLAGAAADSHSDEKADSLFGRFARNGTWVVPTLVVWKRTLLDEKNGAVVQTAERYVPHIVHGFWAQAEKLIQSRSARDVVAQRKMYVEYVSLVPALHRAGVGLLAGTDTTNPYLVPGFSLHEELFLLVKAGLTPYEALQTATINPARFLNRERELGTVKEGKLADLVLLDADPLVDIRNVSKIDGVFADGQYLSHADLQEMLEEVAAAGRR